MHWEVAVARRRRGSWIITTYPIDATCSAHDVSTFISVLIKEMGRASCMEHPTSASLITAPSLKPLHRPVDAVHRSAQQASGITRSGAWAAHIDLPESPRHGTTGSSICLNHRIMSLRLIELLEPAYHESTISSASGSSLHVPFPSGSAAR